jgi:preprotein translocase subunit SecE
MSMLREKVGGAKIFFSEVVAETRKISWPTRQELSESTVVVIVSVLMLSLFVGLCDWVLVKILKLLIPRM